MFFVVYMATVLVKEKFYFEFGYFEDLVVDLYGMDGAQQRF